MLSTSIVSIVREAPHTSAKSRIAMINRHHQRADKVVSEFKQIIGESRCVQISDANFQDLTLLIRDAITDELLEAAELIEKVAMKIRRDTDLHELGP